MEKKRGRHGQTSPGEERGNEIGKVVIAHGSVEFCEATPTGLVDDSNQYLYGRETDRDLRNRVKLFFRIGNQYAEYEK